MVVKKKEGIARSEDWLSAITLDIDFHFRIPARDFVHYTFPIPSSLILKTLYPCLQLLNTILARFPMRKITDLSSAGLAAVLQDDYFNNFHFVDLSSLGFLERFTSFATLHDSSNVGLTTPVSSASGCTAPLGAHLLFYRSDPIRNDGNRLFTTLAWQLSRSIPAIKDHISHFLNEHPDLPTRGVETQFGALILQQRILNVTGTAIKNTDFPLRFLISSRPEAHIEEAINRFEPPILRIDLASLHDANSDVEHCLRGQHIVQRLVSKSAGHFLYAADLIRRVVDVGDDAQTQLDIILTLMPSQPLAELGAASLEILNRVPDQDFLKTFLIGWSLLNFERWP
ncbi:hypothetical protein JOM56_010030 [Amanita muscaria]